MSVAAVAADVPCPEEMMTMYTAPSILQMPRSWHHEGMVMGVHRAWWSFWILALLVLGWALWRTLAGRDETARQSRHEEAAEKELRHQLAKGEIEVEEFAERLRVLRETDASE